MFLWIEKYEISYNGLYETYDFPFIYDFYATSMICITKKERNLDNLY